MMSCTSPSGSPVREGISAISTLSPGIAPIMHFPGMKYSTPSSVTAKPKVLLRREIVPVLKSSREHSATFMPFRTVITPSLRSWSKASTKFSLPERFVRHFVSSSLRGMRRLP